MSGGSSSTTSFGPREGVASYYGKEFNGRRTASGQRYSDRKFTAAHRKLPFGTMVKVTNLYNGKSVTVRVNDRGPFKKGRIIDLSYAAARAIGIVGAGTGRVRIEIVK
jgi:rare lipoprotein A